MANSEKYLNTRDAAKFLGMNEQVLRRKCKMGIIPYTMPCGRYYFAKSQLVAFINNEL